MRTVSGRTVDAPHEPGFKVFNLDRVRDLGIPNRYCHGSQALPDFVNPVVRAKGGEGLRDGLEQSLCCDVNRV